MTRKESIDHLKNMLSIDGFFGDAEKEALKIAIAALKVEPCEDTISRKTALESIRNLYPDIPVMNIMGARRKWLEKYAPYFECENVIEHLPPVKPIKTVTNAKEAEEYKVRPSKELEQNVASSFYFGMALGFGSRYDEKDEILKSIREIIDEKDKESGGRIGEENL